MGYSITPIYGVMWMTFFVSITDVELQWLHQSFTHKLGFGGPDVYVGAR